MIITKYTIYPFIKIQKNNDAYSRKEEGGQVAIRVRWNKSKTETSFYTSVYANVQKWDKILKRAKKGSIHEFGGYRYTHTEINQEIALYKEAIESAFDEYALNNAVPTSKDLKEMVNVALGKKEISVSDSILDNQPYSIKEMFDKFIETRVREKNWNDLVVEKYTQAYQHLMKSNLRVDPYNIKVEQMYKLKDWYIRNRYRNRTINRQITLLKGFFNWLNMQDGFSVSPQVLGFETNLKVLPKTVTFLHYNELLHFAHFNFNGNARLTRARDLWCFMAFTSLRVSDLKDLKLQHIHDGYIEKRAIKTGGRLLIPLVDEARLILERYSHVETGDDYVFNMQSPEKLNIAVKDAAKVAGLDREIVDTYFIGTERIEETHKFYEIISNHDGRRTFVCCSLAMGISPEVVMKSTGHKSYDTMKPYIATATETQILEMEKWNSNQYRSKIINFVDDADETQLKRIVEFLKAL